MKRIAIITLLLLTMGNVIAGSEDMKNTLAQANKLYQDGQFPQAQALYEALLAQYSDDTRLLFHLGQIALLNNNSQQAEQYFQHAYEQSGWWGHRWPMNATIASRIALSYYRADNFKQVAYWYKKAKGPLAIGPFKEIKALARQAEAMSDSAPYVINGPAITTIKFIKTDPLPIVEISLNGQGPYYFFIDTGGADIILDTQTANRLGIEQLGEMKGSFAAGKPGMIGLGVLDDLQVGEINIHHVPINILNLDGVDEILGHEIHGVITTSLLRHFFSTIDYKNQQLILRQYNSINAATINHMADQNVAIPFWMSEMHMILARGHINNLEPTLFFVDTGLAGNGFAISQWLLDDAAITLDWTHAETSLGGGGALKSVNFTLDEVTLGEGRQSISKQAVAAEQHEQDLNIYKGVLGFAVGGTISHSFFRDGALTFDFENMRLIYTEQK